ncbi:MAG: hypothetical protein KC493_04985 [Bacteriovoracaceae bacterium]|nr:hypothetical protein [Bacteriovoracaceae bacterium]
MFNAKNYKTGLTIDNVETCDFESMQEMSNEDILKMGRGEEDQRLLSFVTKKMKIEKRYWATKDQDALDLSRQALKKLVETDPTLLEEAEFLILAGISNPMPTVCTSALLAGELGFKNTSCWDIKSGCSTGVLALIQALDWFQNGAKKGVIVCAETFSKFTNKEILQMAVSIGDGASAMSVSADENVEVLGVVHGTDAEYLKTMYVPGKYPIDTDNHDPSQYFFHFAQKTDSLEKMAYYWSKSLEDLLETSKIEGSDVDHYISHQVDGSKNLLFAKSKGIDDNAVALNFTQYGNMGCPTIFINYHFWLKNEKKVKPGETLIYHAVGGGLSWAGVCLRRRG